MTSIMGIQTAIFKIGGKILDNSKYLINCIAQLTQLYEDNIIQKIILIPGGGSVANFVRQIYNEFEFSEELAHWIAVYSMNFNGIELKKKFPHLDIVDDIKNILKKNKIFAIFLPYKFLKLTDKLPHSWDVTSDSITLYLAHELKLDQCFLLKDVDGIIDISESIIKEISTVEFIKLRKEDGLAKIHLSNQSLKFASKPIDPYITTLIDKFKIPCIILNGASSDLMIFNFFITDKNDNQTYTKIKPV
ncbi:MAG: hypothetical protein ACFE8V_05350 [Promethearchaeota archaeon]